MLYLNYLIFYLIGYVIFLPMYLLSFIWPIILFYVITVTILKYVSTGVLVVYVYIKDFILNIFKNLKKLKGGKK